MFQLFKVVFYKKNKAEIIHFGFLRLFFIKNKAEIVRFDLFKVFFIKK